MKKFYSLLIALLCSATIAFAYEAEIDGIYYDFDHENKMATVTYSVNYYDNIIIPQKVTYNGVEYTVTSIGEGAFYDCSFLTSITIPNSVTEIGNTAFYYCSSLTSVTIGNSVTSIGSSAFSRCSSLTSITIPNSVTEIGNTAFYYCSSLTSVTIGNSVTEIGGDAFEGCSSLTSITIPNSVTSIGNYAFQDCLKLRTIKMGNSIEYIGENTFDGCTALYSFEIETEIPPIIEVSTFTDVSRTMQIKVPCIAFEAYKASSYWNEFSNYDVNTYRVSIDVNDEIMGNAHVVRQATCDDVTALVQAQPQPGYKFVKWSDGFVENPHVVYVKKDIELIAEFAEIDSDVNNVCIVESANEEIGEIDVILLATAIDGFKFSHWSDNNRENPRIISLNKNIELYAYFVMSDQSVDIDVSQIQSADVYSREGILYVEGAEIDYHVLDAAGRLIYTGRDAVLQLPRGVYMVAVGGEVQKVVL